MWSATDLTEAPARIKTKANHGHKRSSNSRVEGREQAATAGIEAGTYCNCCLAGCQQQWSRDGKPRMANDICCCTKENRSGSERALGKVEDGTTEESGVIAQSLTGFLGPIINRSIGNKSPVRNAHKAPGYLLRDRDRIYREPFLATAVRWPFTKCSPLLIPVAKSLLRAPHWLDPKGMSGPFHQLQ